MQTLRTFLIDHGPLAMFLLWVLLVSGTIAGRLFLRYRRYDRMGDWARRHQFEFKERGIPYTELPYQAFQCLKGLGTRQAMNNVYGVWQGHAFHAFDYYQTVHDPKSTKSDERCFTSVVMPSPVALDVERLNREDLAGPQWVVEFDEQNIIAMGRQAKNVRDLEKMLTFLAGVVDRVAAASGVAR